MFLKWQAFPYMCTKESQIPTVWVNLSYQVYLILQEQESFCCAPGDYVCEDCRGRLVSGQFYFAFPSTSFKTLLSKSSPGFRNLYVIHNC